MKTFRLFLLLTCLATHGFGQNMILDTTFQTGSAFDDWVMSTVIQNDGKILCGGWFNEYCGISANHLIRLNPKRIGRLKSRVSGSKVRGKMIYK